MIEMKPRDGSVQGSSSDKNIGEFPNLNIAQSPVESIAVSGGSKSKPKYPYPSLKRPNNVYLNEQDMFTKQEQSKKALISSKKAYGEMVRQVFQPKHTKGMERKRKELEELNEKSINKSRLIKEYVDSVERENANNQYKDYLTQQREKRKAREEATGMPLSKTPM